MSEAHSGWRGGPVTFVRTVFGQFRAKNVSFMAGSIAYSAFVSLLPLLLLLILVASAFGGEAIANYVVNVAGSYLSPTGQDLLANAIVQASTRADLSLISVVVLGWGMLKVFRGLDTAFSAIYGSRRRNDLLDQVRDGLLVLIAMVLALVAVVVAGGVIALFPQLPYVRYGAPFLLIAALTVAFLPVYYVFPDVDVSVREILPGAVVAAVGWTALQAVFAVYVSYSSTAELYGVIGAVVLLVTWLYFGALVLLLGGVVNVVLAGRLPAASPQAHPETT